MPVDADQTRCQFELGVGGMRCANGETWEFWLTFDGEHATNDVGVFRAVHVGDSISAHAMSAFFELVSQPLTRRFRTHRHAVPRGGFFTQEPERFD